MAGTKLDTRQSEHRSALEQVTGSDANKTLKQILPAVDSELTQPFALRANDSGNDLQLNIGPGKITNSETTRNRQFAPIGNQVFNFTSGTVVFPATSGGTITVTPGTNNTLTVPNNEYINILIQVDSNGQLSVTIGTSNAVEANATVPEPTSGNLPIGYITLFNNAGTIDNITDAKITQFSSPSDSSITVEEQDGGPSVTNVHTIKFDNGTLTDEGNGVVSFSSTGVSITGIEKLILTTTGTIVVDDTGTIITKS